MRDETLKITPVKLRTVSDLEKMTVAQLADELRHCTIRKAFLEIPEGAHSAKYGDGIEHMENMLERDKLRDYELLVLKVYTKKKGSISSDKKNSSEAPSRTPKKIIQQTNSDKYFDDEFENVAPIFYKDTGKPVYPKKK